MVRIGLLAGAAVVAAVGLIPSSAMASSHSCTSIRVEHVSVPAVGEFYVDVRDELGNLWIYQESNNVPGLQAGGPGDWGCETYDANNNIITPDKLIF